MIVRAYTDTSYLTLFIPKSYQGFGDACIWDQCTECASWSWSKEMWVCNDDPSANDYGKGCGGGGVEKKKKQLRSVSVE